MIPLEEYEQSKEEQVKGLYEAISFRNRALQTKKPLDENLIRELNRRVIKYVSNGAGKYRQTNVHMSDASFTPSSFSKIPEKMAELVTVISNHLVNLSLGLNNLSEVLSVAAWSHCRLAKIQPFIDGNKRTARLVTDFILARNDLPLIVDWEPKSIYFHAFYTSLKMEQEGPFAHFLAEKLLGRYNELEWRFRNANTPTGLLGEKKFMIKEMVQKGTFQSNGYKPINSL